MCYLTWKLKFFWNILFVVVVSCIQLGKKSSLVSENRPGIIFLSLASPHSRMCVRIYIFCFIQNKLKKIQKQKKTKKKRRNKITAQKMKFSNKNFFIFCVQWMLLMLSVSVENLTGYDDIVCEFTVCTFNLRDQLLKRECVLKNNKLLENICTYMFTLCGRWNKDTLDFKHFLLKWSNFVPCRLLRPHYLKYFSESKKKNNNFHIMLFKMWSAVLLSRYRLSFTSIMTNVWLVKMTDKVVSTIKDRTLSFSTKKSAARVVHFFRHPHLQKRIFFLGLTYTFEYNLTLTQYNN